jgi:3-oxoacyl-[acyl-carrier protein] reductase
MELQLEGKTALVLGAGGGLGAAIARGLASEGARVAVGDIDGDAAQRTASEISAAGARALALPWDLADLDIVDAQVALIEKALGQVDILVNNTGGPPPTPAGGQDLALWRRYFESMVLSVIAVTDRVMPGMRSRGWGRVITSTSSGVIVPIPNLGFSNSLRASLVAWSKTLAREVGRDGITTNIVVPGSIMTNRIHALNDAKARRENRTVEEVLRESADAIPVGRHGRPDEYADVVTFLASPRASYVTGSVVRIDGGMIANV